MTFTKTLFPNRLYSQVLEFGTWTYFVGATVQLTAAGLSQKHCQSRVEGKCNMREVIPGSISKRVRSDREEKEANRECPNEQVTTEKNALTSIGNLGKMI